MPSRDNSVVDNAQKKFNNKAPTLKFWDGRFYLNSNQVRSSDFMLVVASRTAHAIIARSLCGQVVTMILSLGSSSSRAGEFDQRYFQFKVWPPGLLLFLEVDVDQNCFAILKHAYQ
jgi:hypothetical protein